MVNWGWKKSWIQSGLPISEDRLVAHLTILTDVCLLTQDSEDKEFMGIDDIENIKPDPSVGAVLCGFDINISMSIATLLY